MAKEWMLYLTDGESNILLNALNKARMDRANSPLAKKQYTDMYVKLTELKYGEGTAVE